ncbi:UbiD family decarboxylase [Martelella endophytica]|uniref:3-octaprenyl-4-hydroxybenzoate carboxy-lyase n=1 Tax=Martelella endophytica TaxID=1486262 RepID=A0A0D5LQJ9_MAREN|nr:UbiD family decarboxylase [Martelella endophytica]AJY46042.1 3-octaprenyl-4-hydroxybenzoate carboxy-lyase [Martelella endophytica]
MEKNQPPRRFDGLQDFLATLEKRGRLKRISAPVSLRHEITEIHRRVLEQSGPALLFEHPVDADGRTSPIPLVANLFGTRERIEWGFGLASGEIGKLADLLGALRSPQPPASLREAMGSLTLLRSALSLGTKESGRAPCQAIVWKGAEIDLARLPIQWCWPGEPAPLVTWPLVITRHHDNPDDINVGVYRMQVLGKDRLIMRWLSQRGGAAHFRSWQRHGKDMPVTVAIGSDPATILSAVMPLPEGMSELAFAGVLKGQRERIAHALTQPLPVPATAEIVLEGTVSVTEEADEGPYGDHTGYFNAIERFPVMTLSAITTRKNPVYLSTYTGRPPDEPSVLGEAMNALFVPLVKQQFPEIADIHLPPEACSYRAIVVSIDKRYPGQARRVMMGLWSMLPQFSMTKLIIVVDPDIDVRNWEDVMWALSTRFDAARDTLVIDNTPIDYLDFASPKAGLGGKLGLDATTKLGPETEREWGAVLKMSPEVTEKVDRLWQTLGL